MKLQELKMYLIQNSSNQYYRRVGYNGYGACWTDDVSRASVWTKRSTALSRITWFANHYPNYPVPHLIEIDAGEISIVDQSERINKVKAKKQKEEQGRELREKKWAVQKAQQELEQAEARLKKLRGDT